MKIYFYFLFFLLSAGSNIYGQNAFKPLLKPTEKSSAFLRENPEMKNAVIAEMNSRFVKDISNSDLEVFEASIPLDNYGTFADLRFNSFDLVNDDFVVLNAKEDIVDYKKGRFFAALTQKDDGIGAFSFYDDHFMGILSYDDGIVYNVGEIRNADKYIVYRDADFDTGLSFYCATDDNIEQVEDIRDVENVMLRADNKCINLYAEADYALFVENGKDIGRTVDFVLGLFAESALLYKKEGINIKISRIKVWNTKDKYSTKSSADALNKFVDNNINGEMDLGVLLALGGNGLGGLAYINGLCTHSRHFAYTNININYNNIPVYSWSAMVITHELGHNLGSLHTHSCSWNGNWTQIDDCGNVYYFNNGQQPEGKSCFDEDNPIIPLDGGTIMSYCHLVGSAGINLSKGFGDQPNKVINRVVANANCIDVCDNSSSVVPIAEFEGKRDFTCVGGDLRFYDKSINHPQEWIWQFETDKGVDTMYHKYPVMRYEALGSFDVSLISINSAGSDTLLKKDYIKVIEGPTADFDYEFIEKDRVKFNNKSLLSNRYLWKFGDGLVSGGTNPKHRYKEGGVYVVQLRVFRDTCSTYAYYSDTIEVKIPVKARFSASANKVCRGDTVVFTTKSEKYDSIKWIVENGEIINEDKDELSVLYNESGAFDVGLLAYSTYGADTTIKEGYIDVLYSPVADFEYTISGDTIYFQNNSVNSTRYNWYFNGVKGTVSANPEYKFYGASEVDVTLYAINKCDTGVVSKKIITTGIEEQGDEFDLFIYPNPVSGKLKIYSGIQIDGNSILKIYDIYGSILFEKDFSELQYKNGVYVIEVERLKSGVYYLGLVGETNVICKKPFMVIEN